MGLFTWFALSGVSYAVGNILIIAAAALSIFYDKKLFKTLVRIFLILGAAFVLFSPAIMPQALLSILVLSLFSLFFALQLGAGKMGFTHIVRFLLGLCSALALYGEVTYWKTPDAVPVNGRIFILGGSMSAAPKKSAVKSWPEILKNRTGLEILDYSVQGALAKQYADRADVIYGDNIIVFIECGTDDINLKTPISEFKKSVDALFSKLSKPGRKIFAVEIPEYPSTKGAYGKMIRENAAKYGVKIIPKRLSVMLIYRYQLPDLSLNQEGQEKMASLIGSFITSPSEKPQKAP